jgi:beta-N-acetylhexosaminidase
LGKNRSIWFSNRCISCTLYKGLTRRDLHQDHGTVGIPVLAIDKEGQTIDFLLTAHQDKKAAKRFLKKAVSQHELPDKITLDKSGANAAAIEALIEETGCEIQIRPKMRLSPTPTFSQRKIIYRLVLMTLLFWGVPLWMLHSSVEQETNLEVKIGQMLMVGFRGLEVSAEHPIIDDIRDCHLGGVLLFDYDVPSATPVRNIASPTQVKALVSALQAASLHPPLLIAIDQEGGMKSRLKEQLGFPATASAQHLGTLDNLSITREHATVIAQTLAQLGINMNLAPVVDLNINPDNPIIGRSERSFSADPEVTRRHALEFIRAHHRPGVLCTLKHFPGHGSSTGDSHLGLVNITHSWSPIELEPFAALIEAGEADAIMTAHIFNARLDAANPATLSKPIITDLLRERMHYEGVVISDDLQMGAIADYYGLESAIEKAIEAGVDILLIANNASHYEIDTTWKVIDFAG